MDAIYSALLPIKLYLSVPTQPFVRWKWGRILPEGQYACMLSLFLLTPLLCKNFNSCFQSIDVIFALDLYKFQEILEFIERFKILLMNSDAFLQQQCLQQFYTKYKRIKYVIMINKNGHIQVNEHNLQILNNHKLKNISIHPTYGIDVDNYDHGNNQGFIIRGFHLDIYQESIQNKQVLRNIFIQLRQLRIFTKTPQTVFEWALINFPNLTHLQINLSQFQQFNINPALEVRSERIKIQLPPDTTIQPQSLNTQILVNIFGQFKENSIIDRLKVMEDKININQKLYQLWKHKYLVYKVESSQDQKQNQDENYKF